MNGKDPLLGQELADFRLLSVLGRGGMGVVYEAEDLALRRKVALKVLAPRWLEDERARVRFQMEIEHAVAIEHPNVVPVYGAGFERPHFYISMRLISGPDLGHLLHDHGAMPERRALRILGQVGSALHAVHESKLVHRDIKPGNVLLWNAGEEDEHAMLTDFGIAKGLDDPRSITGVGPVGTPAYMAPEVVLSRPATAASDQYSLACMAFEMLSGRLPLEADDAGFPDAHLEQPPTPLHEAAPHISASTARAVDRALEKDPSDRHANLREFVRSAKTADDAFRTSQEVSRVLSDSRNAEDVVPLLSATHGLTDARISHLTGIERTQVVRLRRRQARRTLVGRRVP